MPQITIDNQTFEFEGKPKLLQFCLDHGVELPHFCYHPSMSIPANCRQCLVEIGSPVRDRDSGEVQVDEDGKPVIQFFPKLMTRDRKSTRLNSSHVDTSYPVFCLKKKNADR